MQAEKLEVIKREQAARDELVSKFESSLGEIKANIDNDMSVREAWAEDRAK